MYKLSIELPSSAHRLEQEFISEDAARASAEALLKANSVIRSVGLFYYAYPSQHNPKLIDTFDGQWSADYYADDEGDSK